MAELERQAVAMMEEALCRIRELRRREEEDIAEEQVSRDRWEFV